VSDSSNNLVIGGQEYRGTGMHFDLSFEETPEH
jgi:hypothetical protein